MRFSMDIMLKIVEQKVKVPHLKTQSLISGYYLQDGQVPSSASSGVPFIEILSLSNLGLCCSEF